MSKNDGVTIKMDELMIIASHKTLSNFDSSNLQYHLHDIQGTIEDLSEEFKKQFKDNLLEAYKEDLAKRNLQL